MCLARNVSTCQKIAVRLSDTSVCKLSGRLPQRAGHFVTIRALLRKVNRSTYMIWNIAPRDVTAFLVLLKSFPAFFGWAWL
jgi:hypothetical protein